MRTFERYYFVPKRTRVGLPWGLVYAVSGATGTAILYYSYIHGLWSVIGKDKAEIFWLTITKLACLAIAA